MMTRTHPRMPAVLVLLLVAGGCFLYLRYAADVNADHEFAGESLEALELRIAAGDPPPTVWYAYGQRLVEAGRHAPAAAAFAQVLESEPYNREARFARAIALARADQPDLFFTYMRDLVYSEPRLAVEVLDRGEVRPYLADQRFRELHREAHVQALD